MIIRIVKDWIQRTNKLERVWLLAKIEFKLRYYENKLGLLWALIKPLMDIAIYYTVFQIILKQGVPAFASYLFIGLILWNFFVESTTGTVQILHVKKYLYEYSNMNKLEIYLSTLMSNSIGFFFNFVMFLIFYCFVEKASTGLSWQNFWIIPLFINLFILAMGVSLILSNIYIVAKDIHQIWTVFVSLLLFLSPVFYKLDVFKHALPAFDFANPIAGIIINARNVMMEHKPPSFSLLIFDYFYAIILLILGLFLLNQLGSKAAEKL
jgi:ABC-type polysaccharide/polyol phosphate export permease